MGFNYSNIYFIGIGGIGMSALARYFKYKGYTVSGYDKSESELTRHLVEEGIPVHYEDLGSQVKEKIGEIESTLVVLTPAVPPNMEELSYLRALGYTIQKRSVVLGEITSHWKTLAVAGSHGKTTTSTMLAYVLSTKPEKCSAFLGGISTNFNSNFIFNPDSEWMVVEADEYDRSFLQLSPFSTIITSTDADHLDIYQNKTALIEAFDEYGHLIAPKGKVILHYSADICHDLPRLTYGVGEDITVDYQGLNVRVKNGYFVMDVKTPTKIHKEIVLGLPGIHNAENALAVIAMCESIGIELEGIRKALYDFKGVKRRFEVIARRNDLIYIDDYAHHPTAIKKLLDSVRLLYKTLPITLIFQPHLFSRTRDFLNEFASVLSEADKVILMPIYPAREEPIDGVTSEALANIITTEVIVLEPQQVLEKVESIQEGVILSVGAGNISLLVEPIRDLLV